jgi:hypothetical protein
MSRLTMFGFAVAGLVALSSIAAAQSGWGQIKFWNKTNGPVNFYIDDQWACLALKNLACTVHILPGTHTLSAMAGQDTLATESITTEAGKTYDWTVSK